ncbi:hypothetical protein C0583_07045 [Candidatus Parcubacteria bacterium]|nr:MAG: hypothetical protein C0583_07045 [Candidatus Parcubacteria bacterium]
MDRQDKEKLSYPGHEVINKHFPGITLRTFISIYLACQAVSKNKVLPAIVAGMNNGLGAYHEKLRDLKCWPEDITITKQRYEDIYIIQKNDCLSETEAGPDAKKFFRCIYEWLSREENTCDFLFDRLNKKIKCGNCGQPLQRKKKEIRIASKNNQGLLCEHCGHFGQILNTA